MAAPRPAGWWYPWIFVAGMTLVIAVNGVMIAYAIGTFPGLSVDDAYRKGLAYNDTLAAARAQEKRGWRADLSFDARPEVGAPHAGELRIHLADRSGSGLGGLAVSALLLRPTHSGTDVPVVLEDRGGGEYRAAVTLPSAGQWDAQVHAQSDVVEWQTTWRIFVP